LRFFSGRKVLDLADDDDDDDDVEERIPSTDAAISNAS